VTPALNQNNRRLSGKLAVIAVGMFGFGFALVPFYNQICAALGVNQLIERDAYEKNTQVDTSRTVTVGCSRWSTQTKTRPKLSCGTNSAHICSNATDTEGG
jgi:cytochrome c oxidase assembly protein Cox11